MQRKRKYIKEGKLKEKRMRRETGKANEKMIFFRFIGFGGESNFLTKWKVEVGQVKGLEGDFFLFCPCTSGLGVLYCVSASTMIGPCLVRQRTHYLCFRQTSHINLRLLLLLKLKVLAGGCAGQTTSKAEFRFQLEKVCQGSLMPIIIKY